MSATTTREPARPKPRQYALPIPWPPPVTITTLSLSPSIIVIALDSNHAMYARSFKDKSSFPRRRESRPFPAWIPGLASQRQLARNDVGKANRLQGYYPSAGLI